MSPHVRSTSWPRCLPCGSSVAENYIFWKSWKNWMKSSFDVSTLLTRGYQSSWLWDDRSQRRWRTLAANTDPRLIKLMPALKQLRRKLFKDSFSLDPFDDIVRTVYPVSFFLLLPDNPVSSEEWRSMTKICLRDLSHDHLFILTSNDSC